MNELALFAGIGGGILGGKLLGWTTVCYVENNAYCIEILKARIDEGYLCDAPIWGDIKTFDGKPWSGSVDIITAGFPCQPFSVAGKRRGADDSRNMWPETIRVIREVRPRYALCENVPGLISGDHGYFGRIFNDLSESGYNARWRIVSAADVGAPHLRKRLWILANSRQRSRRPFGIASKRGNAQNEQATDNYAAGGSSEDSTSMADPYSDGAMPIQQQGQRDGSVQEGAIMADAAHGRGTFAEQGLLVKQSRETADRYSRCGSSVPNADNTGCGTERIAIHAPQKHIATQCCGWWDNDPAEDATESQVGRVAHGVPCRVDRLKAIGNAQVPGVAKLAWELLSGER